MGLETVKEHILDSAKSQANSILADARKETAKIAKDAEKKLAELQQKLDADEKRTIDTTKRQELASAELENKKSVLEAKKHIIDSAFESAKKKLEALDDKKRDSIIKRLLERAKSEIEVEKIYCSRKDAKFAKGTSVEPASMIGGLVAENKDGTIRIDYSFETILDGIKESELQNISKIIFG